jgi:hypothetical protein
MESALHLENEMVALVSILLFQSPCFFFFCVSLVISSKYRKKNWKQNKFQCFAYGNTLGARGGFSKEVPLASHIGQALILGTAPQQKSYLVPCDHLHSLSLSSEIV